MKGRQSTIGVAAAAAAALLLLAGCASGTVASGARSTAQGSTVPRVAGGTGAKTGDCAAVTAALQEFSAVRGHVNATDPAATVTVLDQATKKITDVLGTLAEPSVKAAAKAAADALVSYSDSLHALVAQPGSADLTRLKTDIARVQATITTLTTLCISA